ncbi:MAG: hypothetical protein M3376_06060 [Actinomycetota bacterium]|nr:hypothetical protein [Actinomycetota bacterium]
MLDPGLQDEVEHDVLVAAGARCGAGGDDTGDPLCAAVPEGAAQDIGDLADARQPFGLRLAHGSLQAPVRELRSDLEQRAGGRRRDPLRTGDIAWRDRARSLKDDRVALAYGRPA